MEGSEMTRMQTGVLLGGVGSSIFWLCIIACLAGCADLEDTERRPVCTGDYYYSSFRMPPSGANLCRSQ
jgi:hypothetical protein